MTRVDQRLKFESDLCNVNTSLKLSQKLMDINDKFGLFIAML